MLYIRPFFLLVSFAGALQHYYDPLIGSLSELRFVPHDLEIFDNTYLIHNYRSTGFILEGFPSFSEEMRLLSEQGWYPDAVVSLQVCYCNMYFLPDPYRNVQPINN